MSEIRLYHFRARPGDNEPPRLDSRPAVSSTAYDGTIIVTALPSDASRIPQATSFHREAVRAHLDKHCLRRLPDRPVWEIPPAERAA